MRTLRQGASGSDVLEVQSVLKKIGLDPGAVDGVYGEQTQKAVAEFQKQFGLTPDGIIGP